MKSRDLPQLYSALCHVGDPLGLTDFGSYALNVMRIEKGYHGWGSDFGTEYTPFDAGLERFVSFDKPGFTGRDAVLAQREHPAEWRFVGFEIDSDDADALPSDPIIRDGRVVGYVTSAAYGYRLDKRLALGYIERGAGGPGDTFAIEILGRSCPAKCREPHFYDPDNSRMRM